MQAALVFAEHKIEICTGIQALLDILADLEILVEHGPDNVIVPPPEAFRLLILRRFGDQHLAFENT